MWEFAVRLVLAGLLLTVSGWTDALPFAAASSIAGFTAMYSAALYAVERRGKTNPGLAGLCAGLDCLGIAAAAAYAGVLGSLAFLVLGPIIFAVAKRGSNPASTGAIGAASVIFADGLVNGNVLPAAPVMAQAAGVLIVSLLANQPRVVVRPRTIKEMISELAEPTPETGTQALIELREKYRRLATNFKDLERRSRIDRLRSQLFLAKSDSGNGELLASKICELLGASGAILYTAGQIANRMVVSASAGAVPHDAETLSIDTNGRETAAQLRAGLENAVNSIADGAARRSCNVLLRSRGKVIGMLTLFCANSPDLSELTEKAEEAAETIAQILLEERKHRSILRRLSEAELMYELACRLDGAATHADLGRRAAKALSEIITCQHVGVWLLDKGRPILAGKEGRPCRFFESYAFDEPGLAGWLALGAPGVFLPDTTHTAFLETGAAARERIGSYISVAIRAGDEVVGFIAAAASAPGALGQKDLQTLLDVSAELARVLDSKPARTAHGLVSVAEFQKEVLEHPADQACIVYLEPLHFEELTSTVGTAALELAGRQLGLLIKRHAPDSAQICRKSDGNFMVMLPDITLQQAEQWANEITALSAMRTLERGDKETAIPLAIRAKAADLSQKPERIAGETSEVA